MAEPEDVIAAGAYAATRLARDLWARRAAGAGRAPPGLSDLRRRLDLLVAAVFPSAPEIGVADPPAPPTLLARLARRAPARLHRGAPLASTDGVRIRLPRRLDGVPGGQVARRYQLLALEQAARAVRGTPAFVPTDRLLRDLFLLSEAVAIDIMLIELLPGLAVPLRGARAEALAQRPDPKRVTLREAAVERLLRTALGTDPGVPPPTIGCAPTPADSVLWARTEAARLEGLAGSYHGVAPVLIWGTTAPPPEGTATAGAEMEGVVQPIGRQHTLPRRPRVREADEDEDDPTPGTWMVRADDPQEKAEDPAGLSRPADRDGDTNPGELADALSELPEARLVRTPEAPREVLASEDPIRRAPGGERSTTGAGIAYPEWDWNANAYREPGAIVHESTAPAGDPDWVEHTLRRHAALIRGVRRDFERLRPRRTSLKRQPDGAELDIDACVADYADRRGGGAGGDRFYVDSRPLRRDVAITLLVDVSASTDGWVSGDRRIVDVEKEAVLVVGEALVALGDPHGVLAFCSAGPSRVTVQALKRFGEPIGPDEFRRRIAGLESAGYTRAGAALRHATAGLMRMPARHRLLLLLSDGRPNDVDQYEGRYGVEDTRVAVAEARFQGVHCFCLTVDREAPRYAARIFGRDFAVLPRAEQLPRVLSALLRDLVRR